jgi:Uma2 family endonuclease
MTPAPRLTTDEYLRTPETVLPQELVYGVMRVADAPAPRHQAALRDVGVALVRHLDEHPVGQVWFAPVDVVLDRARALVVQPDLIFVSTGRLRIVQDRVWGAPDLVLEVLSPRPRIGRLDERVGWFAEYGVRECWLLQQDERRLDVLTFKGRRLSSQQSFSAGERILSAVLPAFDLSLQSMLRA